MTLDIEDVEHLHHEDSLSNTDDEADSDSSNAAENLEDNPLYAGAPISVLESMMMIFMLSIRFKLSGECLSHILEIIELHCPKPNNCIKTMYKFRKYFKNQKTPIVKQFYCNTCLVILKNRTHCFTCGKLPSNDDYFVRISIIQQVQDLFNRSDFRKKLNYKNDRVKENMNNFEDIFDGSVHEELSQENGVLADHNNLSLTWYSDGVNIYKSSKYSIWPFLLTINNLPVDER